MLPRSQQEVSPRPASCSGLAGTSVGTSMSAPWGDSAARVSSLFLSVIFETNGDRQFHFVLLYSAQTIAIRTPRWEQMNECGLPFLKRIRH